MGTIIAIVAVGIAAAALVYAHRVNKRQNAAMSDVYAVMTKKVCAARDEVRIDFQKQLSTATAGLSARLDALENGAIPDYEKAKEIVLLREKRWCHSVFREDAVCRLCRLL